MKKRISIWLFIFMMSVFYLSVPSVVFGQSAQDVLNEYRETFRHPDVHEFFPDILGFFKAPDIQIVLNPIVIRNFANDPKFIQRFIPNVDSSIIVLLTIDAGFQALFRDEDFHEVFQNPTQIETLAKLIKDLEPLPPEGCEIPESDPPEATTLAIVSGNNQTGESGMLLVQPFVVGVLDQNQQPLRDISVTFRVTAGDGRLTRLTTRTIKTDKYGQARTTLTLGPGVGSNRVEATVPGLTKQTFNATAKAPEKPQVTTLAIVSGNNQTGESGMLLVQPFVVGVLDQNQQPLRDISVTFRVTAGDGRLTRLTTRTIKTDEYGQARTTLTLGPGAGSNRVEATVPGLTKQIFNATATDSDVNGDGIISLIDLSIIITLITKPNPSIAKSFNADVNNDKIVDYEDLVLVANALDSIAAAPSVHALAQSGISVEDVQALLIQAKTLPEATQANPVYQRSIIVLEQLLVTLTQVPVVPKQTALLVNYPNPFNPETWIPYQLSEASDVTVTIYAVDGSLIRTLALGHQPAGLYQRKSRAAYWDGRNAFGERVASGLYFYTLTAGDFTATRKMLIRK